MKKVKELPPIPPSFPARGWRRVKTGETIQEGDFWEHQGVFTSAIGQALEAHGMPLWRFVGPQEQPNTSTLAGKIELMQAAESYGRFQWQEVGSGQWHTSQFFDAFHWNWVQFLYRIHPDDLNPPSWDDKTFNAWFESVQHWERFSLGTSKTGETPFGYDCALCKVFAPNGIDCTTCPVKQKTGMNSCKGSPWTEASQAFRFNGKESQEFKGLAKKELDFLLSLLSEDMKERYEEALIKEAGKKAAEGLVSNLGIKKKEPQYRAWKDASEVPVGALIKCDIRNQGPSVILAYDVCRDTTDKYILFWCNGVVTGESLASAFRQCKVSYEPVGTPADKRTWLPCGVKL